MADISTYSIEDPAFYDFFGGDSGIYKVIRDLKLAFEERFALDHYFDVDLTTTDPECDGYHMYVTMQPFSGISSTTGQEILDPEEIDDGVILYCKTIDGKPELCIRNQDGCYQISDDGELAIYENAISLYPIPSSYLRCKFVIYGDDGNLILVTSSGVFYSTDFGATIKLLQLFYGSGGEYGNGFFIVFSATQILTIRESDWSISTWTNPYLSSSLRCCSYGNGVFAVGGMDDGITGGAAPLYKCLVIFSSTGDNTWNRVLSVRPSNFNGFVYEMAYSITAGKFVAKANYMEWYSADGNIWVSFYSGFNTLKCVNGVFFSVLTGNHLYCSVDGTTWVDTGLDMDEEHFFANIIYDGSRFLAIGDVAGTKIYSSTNGVNWSLLITLDDAIHNIGFFRSEFGYFVARRSNNFLYETEDFTTFTLRNDSYTFKYAVAFSIRTFFVLLSSNVLVYFGYPKLD